MRNLTRGQIELILKDEIDRATARCRVASNDLKTVMSDIPSGIPVPDGALRIKKAGEDHRAALAAHQKALDRWNGFILYGNIPDEFLGS